MNEQQDETKQKPPRTPPGPPDFIEGPQLPTPEQLADWQRFQQRQEQGTEAEERTQVKDDGFPFAGAADSGGNQHQSN